MQDENKPSEYKENIRNRFHDFLTHTRRARRIERMRRFLTRRNIFTGWEQIFSIGKPNFTLVLCSSLLKQVSYKEAFDYFDWNKSGTIPTSDLQCAMRRAGQNPTDVEVFLQEFNQCSMSNVQCHMSNAECSLYPSNVHETIFSCGQVQDMVNKIDDGSGVLDFEDFLLVMILDQCV